MVDKPQLKLSENMILYIGLVRRYLGQIKKMVNETSPNLEKYYFYADAEAAPPQFAELNVGPKIPLNELIRHLLLFLATVITTTIAGAIFPYLLLDAELSQIYHILTTSAVPIINGLLFSFTLLVILGMHELGHYLACRYYGITASLPYFIPIPPPLGIGTLGAFIRIKSPIQTRKALFDVGLSGPLAGFIFAVPAAIVGIYYSHANPSGHPEAPIIFHQPLLFVLISKILGVSEDIAWNPVWFACWVGMLATALNLLPVGQLDGGHVVYALFGKQGHRAIAIAITLSQIATATIAYLTYNWAGGFIYSIMLIVLLVLRHPQVTDEEAPLGRGRKIFGLIALIVFTLSFMPAPIKIN